MGKMKSRPSAIAPVAANTLENKLGYSFSNPGLLQQALTHSSAVTGRAKGQARGDYERLEFLGDRVLGLIVADLLYHRYENADQGHIARRFNALVRKETLADVAQTLDLGPSIIFSDGERAAGGAEKPAILADVMEAIFGAMFLDGGLEPVNDLIGRLWADRIEDLQRAPKDAKTQLQEWAHSVGRAQPVYEQAGRSGPDHAPEFTVKVMSGEAFAIGKGGSKRLAEQEAAQALLSQLAGDAHD